MKMALITSHQLPLQSETWEFTGMSTRIHVSTFQNRVQLLRCITPAAQYLSANVISGTTVVDCLGGVVAPGL